MPKFFYKIVTKDNKIKEGFISAFLKRSAQKNLTSDGSTIIFLSPETPGIFQREFALPFSGLSQAERIDFFRNFSMMNSAGLAVVETLEILTGQVKNHKVKKAIRAIAEEVKNGEKIAKAMSKFPQYFPENIVETIDMGDVAGRLNETLDRIANDLERNEEIKRKVIGALVYPAIVISLMVVIVVGLIFYILPEIEKIFEEFNAPLPLPTQILIYISDFVRLHFVGVLGLILVLVFLFLILLKTEKGRYAIHYLMLKFPIFGKLIKEYNLIIFFRSLEALIASGISLVNALQISQKTLKNDVYKKALGDMHPILLRGVPLADILEPYPLLFSEQTQKIIGVGEKTGKLEETFRRVIEYYERSVDYTTRMLTVLLEPILMVILGIAVGGLALSIFLPLYQVVNVI